MSEIPPHWSVTLRELLTELDELRHQVRTSDRGSDLQVLINYAALAEFARPDQLPPLARFTPPPPPPPRTPPRGIQIVPTPPRGIPRPAPDGVPDPPTLGVRRRTLYRNGAPPPGRGGRHAGE